jgi:hypothetical protein
MPFKELKRRPSEAADLRQKISAGKIGAKNFNN